MYMQFYDIVEQLETQIYLLNYQLNQLKINMYQHKWLFADRCSLMTLKLFILECSLRNLTLMMIYINIIAMCRQ